MPDVRNQTTIGDIDALLDGELSKRVVQAFRQLNLNAKDLRTDRKGKRSIVITLTADVQSDDRNLIEYGVKVDQKFQPVKGYKKGFAVNVRDSGDISIVASGGPIDGQVAMDGSTAERPKLVLHSAAE